MDPNKVEQLTTNFTSIADGLRTRASKVERILDFLTSPSNLKLLDKIDVSKISGLYGTVDFTQLNRDEVLAVIKHFGGIWDKQEHSERLSYMRRELFEDFRINIWQGELPSSCRIVEEEVVVPRHTTTRRRIVCK